MRLEKSSIGLAVFSLGIFIGLGIVSAESLKLTANVGADVANVYMKVFRFPFSIVFALISAFLILFKDYAIPKEKIKKINFMLIVVMVLFGGFMAKMVYAPRFSDSTALSAAEPAAAPNASRQ